MARIQQLSPQVVARIAAGEVIERPASVVKELLENAVDAGSTRIDVDVGQGGADYVRVVDDGCGIEADDLPLAFAAHATSKLRSADDLFQIDTLGFRGEGLASIGGVAQVTLQSRTPQATCGAEIRCNGGDLAPVRVWNGTPGTRIEVRHLFFNIPVRRKFLRSTATEMGQVCEVFIRLALSQLSLHLTLKHNGKLVYEVPASAGLLDRIGLFFGAEVRDKLYMVEAEHGRTTLAGYVADPCCERGHAQMQYLFVNGRWIRDRILGQALQEAYRSLLMTGRHPVAFLFLELPPDEVDVNVHPTKAEVRFRDREGLQQFVEETVRARLQGQDLTAPLRSPPPVRPTSPTAPEPDLPFQPLLPRPPVADAPGSPLLTPPPAAPLVPSAERRTPEVRNPSPALRPERAPVAAAPVRAIQVHDLYLVVEVPDGLLVIDQHALHERVLYEQLRERLRQGPLEVQRLLIPEPVQLPAAQAARVLEQKEALAELGLEISDFGGGTVLLSSYPAVLGKRRPHDILRALADYLIGQDRLPSREEMFNDLLSLIACHSAVRAGDRLAPEEIAALVAQRDLARDAHHCPHGRPTSLLFSCQDLERQFRRA